jgi:hypothetical protein
MNDKFVVKIYYYDLGETIKNKFGEFDIPLKESVVRRKHMLESFYEIDDAKPLSPFELEISNKEIINQDGEKQEKIHTQKLTTNEPLRSEINEHEKALIKKYQADKKGALPLMNVKLNPFYYQAQLEVKSLKEMKKAGGTVIGGMKFEDVLIIGGILIVAAVIFYAFYSGMITL